MRLRLAITLSAWLIIAVQFLSGCSWRTTEKPAFLVIAVEGLNADSIDCAGLDEEFEKGLGVMCKEGVRFTHAYTPSTQAQAVLASILTGLYPKNHGVWHNGPTYLTEETKTVTELAISHGYRTGFFSGGPPIWRKSGLGQGFEVFDDNVSISMKDFYRPARKTVDLFLNWLGEIGDRAPFFGFLYFADLQFFDSNRVSVGEERGRTSALGFERQLFEVNLAMVNIVNQLKKLNQWDNTYIVLVGVNGRTSANRSGEFNAINLYSENTQVAMIVKPARKARDASIDWSIDANVSVVDLGETFFDILGATATEHTTVVDRTFEVASLRSALQKPQVTWPRDRLILSESAWPLWRGVSNSRTAVRQNHLLLINDAHPKIYNSLTDRFENQTISLTDTSVRAAVSEIVQILIQQKIATWEGLPPNLSEKMIVAHKFFDLSEMRNRESLVEQLAALSRQRPWDRQLIGWRARLAIERQDWAMLDKLGSENIYPAWSTTAQKQMQSITIAQYDACLALVEKSSASVVVNSQNKCLDSEWLAYVEFLQAADKDRALAAEEKLTRTYISNETEEAIAKMNFVNSLNWDTQVDIPAEPRLINLYARVGRQGKLPQSILTALKSSK